MVEMKIISSLEKCFWDEKIESKKILSRATLLKNERFSFEAAYAETSDALYAKQVVFVKIDSPIADFISVSRIDDVPLRMPAYKDYKDENYLRTEPGLYPDLMIPVTEKTQLYVVPRELKSLWFDVYSENGINAGIYPVKISLENGAGEEIACASIELEVIDAMLPEQDIAVTQWFHSDCLSVYYQAPVFSDEYWRIVENFIKTAVKNGINTILTPVFTPPLDTAVGGERPTVQLVSVKKSSDGSYSFGYDNFDKWVSICEKCGVKHYEISHLFTQWGAAHAPKIMACVDGKSEPERIFGWETDAHSEEYRIFLRAFVSDLLCHIEKIGLKGRCFWHISDEPGGEQLQSYLKSKEAIADLLKGEIIMDALSNYEFYESGAVENPIPANNHIEPFIEHNVPNLWTYYCCGQAVDVSNRFVAMPGARNRIIGTQFYKFNIVGFFLCGYNFYFSQYSVSPINPYTCTDGEYFVPAGDAFSVYPAPDGTAYETMHLVHFTQALTDLRALKLAQSLCGRDAVMAAIENGIDPITFKSYPHDSDYLINMRETINGMIKQKLNK